MLKQNTKELHQGRQFSYKKIKAYHQRYIDNNTGFFKETYTQKRVCPVCNHTKSVVLFKKSGGQYTMCNKCHMIYINPVFKPQSLVDYYKDLDTGQSDIVKNESSFYREIYLMGLQKIFDNIDYYGSILDIGCGGGFFLDIAKENGWSTFGVEPNSSDKKICKNKGHIIYRCLDDVTQSFDVITLWDTFEHIVNPNKYLTLLSSYLKQDGIVFIQTPNTDSLASRILQERCNMFDGLEHVNLYNPKTINLVLESNGFKILSMDTVISELGVVNNYLNYDNPYFGNTESVDEILGFINDNLVHNNLLGYKIQLVCDKK